MSRRRVATPNKIPDATFNAWLGANKIDPGEVLAEQQILVTDSTIAYIGWPHGPTVLVDNGMGFKKLAYVVPLLVAPEEFGLVTHEE